jgi:hypothetical protein
VHAPILEAHCSFQHCLLQKWSEDNNTVVASKSKAVGETSGDLVLLLYVGDSVDTSNLGNWVVLVQSWVHPPSGDSLDDGNGLHTSSASETVSNHGLGTVHLHVVPIGEHLLHSVHLSNVTHQGAGDGDWELLRSVIFY